MSWFRVDDGWADSAKVDAISDAAARLWAICGTWCSKKENLRKFDGFVPRAALQTITRRRWNDEQLEAAILDLVDTSKVGGLFECGLWEEVAGGWKFHDWDKYKPRESDEPALTPSEAASIAGQASAAARKEKSGTAQPKKPTKTPNGSRTVPERAKPFEKTFGRTEPSNGSRTLEPPDPDPDPDPRSDLTQISSQRPESSVRARPVGSGVGSKVPEIAMENRHVTNADVLSVPGNKPAKSDGEPARHRTRLSDLENDFPALCRAFEENPHNASFYPVQTRPEVLELHSAWCEATGLSPRRLGAFQRDAGVRAICALYALDYSRADLLALVQCAGKDKWIMGLEDGPNGRPKDIAVLSPTKAGALLDLARVVERKAAKAKARRDAELEQARREQQEETERKREPRPVPVDIETLFATVPSTGFTLSPPRRPRVETTPGTYRRFTPEELENELAKRPKEAV